VTPVFAINWQGAESSQSVAILVDTTPPTLSAQLTPAANGAGWNNSTPVGVALSAADGTGSGVHQILYTTDGSDPTTSGTAALYTAGLSISANTTIRYFATDNAGNASGVQTQLVRIDTVAPAGGSVDATGLLGAGFRYSTSTTLSVAFTKGTDGGSGLAGSGAQLLRASATLTSGGTSDGVCGTYTSYTQVGTNDPATPKSDTVADHACYRYEYVVADNVGNQTTYTSPDIKVDTTVPPAPVVGFSAFTNASATGSIVYYQPGAASGSFTTTATASDLFSGIASYAFPTLPSGWTSMAGALGVEVYSYSAANPTAPSGNQTVTATNDAGDKSGTTAFTVVADATAPSGGSITYTAGYYTTASVSVAFSPGTDAGSGVNAASGVLQRASTTLSAGTCGTTYSGFATVATAPTSPYADATGLASGNCYEYRYVVSDAVGNPATYTSANVVKVDTQAPTQAFTLTSPVNASFNPGTTTLYYNGALTGSFKFVDTLTDSVSGVASATFPSIATTGWTHLTETQGGAGPFTSTSFGWTASPSTPSGYSVSGTGVAGNTAGVGITFTSDTTAPSGGSITSSSGVLDTLSVTVTPAGTLSDSQSGVASAVVKRDQVAIAPTPPETCGTFPGTFATTVTLIGGADTSVTSGNCYEYEYVVTDNVGNQAIFTSPSVAKVDTSGPKITSVSSLDAGGVTDTGLLAVGAKLIFTFDESLGTVPTSVSGATETRGASALGILAPDVILTIPGLLQGASDTGTAGYFVDCLALCAPRAVTFAGSVASAGSGASTTLTLTVTSITAGGDTPSTGSGTIMFTPATTITDAVGHAASGSYLSSGFRLF
jgi:hypothetical protein